MVNEIEVSQFGTDYKLRFLNLVPFLRDAHANAAVGRKHRTPVHAFPFRPLLLLAAQAPVKVINILIEKEVLCTSMY